MEYFIGFLVSVISFIILNRIVKNVAKSRIPTPVFTQSRKVALVKDYILDSLQPKERPKTQSSEDRKKNSMMAYFWEDSVYWIEDGFLVTAELKNNQVDETTKKRVDTHSLNKVELDKMIFIVDKLTEGKKNDSSDSGK